MKFTQKFKDLCQKAGYEINELAQADDIYLLYHLNTLLKAIEAETITLLKKGDISLPFNKDNSPEIINTWAVLLFIKDELEKQIKNYEI